MAVKGLTKFLTHITNRSTYYSKINTSCVKHKWWSSTPIKTDVNYKIVKPGKVSNQITHDMLPNHVNLPPYAESGIPPPNDLRVSTYKFV